MVYQQSSSTVQATEFSKIYTLLANCTRPTVVAAMFAQYYNTCQPPAPSTSSTSPTTANNEKVVQACTVAMSTLETIVKIGLPKLTPSTHGIEEMIVLSTWETILEVLRTIGTSDQRSDRTSAHSVALLNVVVDCALPLLHEKQVPRSIQENLVTILDQGCTIETSPSLRQACTKQLFMLCGETPSLPSSLPSSSSSSSSSSSETTVVPPTVAAVRRSSADHIAAAVAPVVLERCKQSLLEFVAAAAEGTNKETTAATAATAASGGSDGVETSEHAKVLQVLEQLQVLNMHPDAFNGRGSKAHLIELFPVLCDCISALGSTSEERSVSKALASLLKMVGEEAL